MSVHLSLPPADHIESRIHYAPEIDIVYLKNPKAGCSSITKSLWLRIDELRGIRTFQGRVHSRKAAPFCQDLSGIAASGVERFLAAEFFAVVRNPYARILSCYLDKIAKRQRDAKIWIPFADRFGLDRGATPSFRRFLRLITAEDPRTLNWHYCPQRVCLLHPLPLRMDFIGRLEEMDETAAFLRRHGVVLKAYTPHSTGASDLIADYYGPKETALVREFYALDFELYGYSEDPAVAAPVRPAFRDAGPREALAAIVRKSRPSAPRRIAGYLRARAARFPALRRLLPGRGAAHPAAAKR